MPRLTPAERVERAREAIAAAVASVEAATERGRYDEAWKAAEELARVLDQGRSDNAAARGSLVARLVHQERFRLRELADRFGVSMTRLAKLSASAKGRFST
jgi:DNA-binding XRE family transcriptional regulator